MPIGLFVYFSDQEVDANDIYIPVVKTRYNPCDRKIIPLSTVSVQNSSGPLKAKSHRPTR
jgi:hypothetical protein